MVEKKVWKKRFIDLVNVFKRRSRRAVYSFNGFRSLQTPSLGSNSLTSSRTHRIGCIVLRHFGP